MRAIIIFSIFLLVGCTTPTTFVPASCAKTIVPKPSRYALQDIKPDSKNNVVMKATWITIVQLISDNDILRQKLSAYQ